MTERYQEPLSPEALRHAFSQFGTGVCVASTRLADGRSAGITVNSFTSVSLDPPLALFCIGNGSQLLEAFGLNTRVAISVLAGTQQAASNAFARSATQIDHPEFLTTEFAGVPAIEDAAAVMVGHVDSRVTAGDHTIILVRLEALEVNAEAAGNTLWYFRGGYTHANTAKTDA